MSSVFFGKQLKVNSLSRDWRYCDRRKYYTYVVLIQYKQSSSHNFNFKIILFLRRVFSTAMTQRYNIMGYVICTYVCVVKYKYHIIILCIICMKLWRAIIVETRHVCTSCYCTAVGLLCGCVVLNTYVSRLEKER